MKHPVYILALCALGSACMAADLFPPRPLALPKEESVIVSYPVQPAAAKDSTTLEALPFDTMVSPSALEAPPPITGARPFADYPPGPAATWETVPFETAVYPDLVEGLPEIATNAATFGRWKGAGTLAAGEGATATGDRATAIGKGATVTDHDGTAVGSYTTAGQFGTAVGNYQTAAPGDYALALGSWATADAFQAIQLGPGQNFTENSLQVLQWPLLVNGLIPFARLPYRDLQALAENTVSEWTNAVVVVSNDVLRVDVEDPQGKRTVWSSAESKREEIDALKQQARQLLARIEALEQGGGASSWNEWAADGSANPEPDFMTMLNAPATLFASGFSWESSGAYSVLVQSGSVAYSTGTDSGSFHIGPNSTNYFGFRTGGSIVVGAKCKGFSIERTPDGNVAHISYPYQGGDFPVLWYTPDFVKVDFAEQTGIAWVDNLDGTATATAPAIAEKGFWMATTTTKIDNIFETTMPAYFAGGVLANTNSAPIVFDEEYEWESGGVRYRIPVQRVVQ